MNSFSFKTLHMDKKTKARVGEITTPHGVIHTPAFVPVGTQATVKSLTPEELDQSGVELFFVNTYHAYLRPGIEVIKKFGGLHRFMNWDRPLITDSGGFQVFSLANKRYVNIAISESAVLDRQRFTKKLTKHEARKEHVYPDEYRPIGELVKIDDDGVTFTSHWDGSEHRFTPEVSVSIQHALGADLIVAFDECAPYPTTREYAQKALERTHRWANRSLVEHRRLYSSSESKTSREVSAVIPGLTGNPKIDSHFRGNDIRGPNYSSQALYGVIQGSVYEDLRKESADFINALDFDGIAIGGVAVGESKEEMRQVIDWVVPRLLEEKPRHLLGVGEIDDIFDIIERGVDTFDCVQPTRLARMGHLYRNDKFQMKDDIWTIDITKKIFAQDTTVIDSDCTCYTCRHFSRGYLHHLFRVRELLGYRLATIHNLHFVLTLVDDIRKSIKKGTFLQFRRKFFRIE